MLAVPGSVARAPDVQAWRRATVRRLLEAEDLGFVSVWSPTFLTGLMEHVQDLLPEMLPALPPARAASIERALDAAGAVTGRALWPRLSLISCWTDGHAARFVRPLADRFEGVEIQPKGLLATEGVFSFPLSPIVGGGVPPGAVTALTSHVLELVDLEAPERRPVPVYEARAGARYAPLLSTRGGLLRYRLGDEVRCVGHAGAAPCFVFLGKQDNVSDLCGEKLSAGDAERALAQAERRTGVEAAFAMLAPRLDGGLPGYRLFLEGPTTERARDAFAEQVERGLLDNHHYRYARDLGQLAAVEVRAVRAGAARYEAALVARGRRAGDIKPTPLDKRTFWDEVFGSEESDGLEDAT